MQRGRWYSLDVSLTTMSEIKVREESNVFSVSAIGVQIMKEWKEGQGVDIKGSPPRSAS